MNNSSENPLVSVLIPCYNPGKYLKYALESILLQTYHNLEIIVIDDGSTDNSVAEISCICDARLKLITQENSGKSSALNKAIAASSGEYILIQDADDYSYPTRVADMLHAMRQNSNLAMLFSGHDLIIGDKTIAPICAPLSVAEAKKCIDEFSMPGHDPTVMVKTRIAREFLFDPKLSIGQGFDFVLRVGEKYPSMRIGKCLYSYRISQNSNTKANAGRRIIFVRSILRRAYLRRNQYVPHELSADNDHFIEKSISLSDRDNNIAAHFIESVIDLKRQNKYLNAIAIGLYCTWINPKAFHYYKPLIYSFCPNFFILYFRTIKRRLGRK